LWDAAFFDTATATYTVESYLDGAERDFGGFDVSGRSAMRMMS
jgi:hypothetical protein